MKSPLKFLSQLMSRGRPAEPPQILIGHHDAVQEKREAEETPIPAEVPTSMPAVPGANEQLEIELTSSVAIVGPEIQSASEEAASFRSIEDVLALPEANVAPPRADVAVLPEIEPGVNHARPRAKRTPRLKAKPAQIAAAIDLTVKNRHKAASPLSAEPANTAVSLDAEIIELRKQLAQKLRSQNDQLKKMLKRFDRF